MVDKIGWTEPLGSGRGVMEFVRKRAVRCVRCETWIDEWRRRKCIIVRVRGFPSARVKESAPFTRLYMISLLSISFAGGGSRISMAR